MSFLKSDFWYIVPGVNVWKIATEVAGINKEDGGVISNTGSSTSLLQQSIERQQAENDALNYQGMPATSTTSTTNPIVIAGAAITLLMIGGIIIFMKKKKKE